MNRITAVIKNIETDGKLSIVDLSERNYNFKTIVIENPSTAEYLKIGHQVNVLFKETEVVIGKAKKLNISLRNQIPCILENIEKGKLLSRLQLTFGNHTIHSIITSKSVELLELKSGDQVLAMVKTNEIMLEEC